MIIRQPRPLGITYLSIQLQQENDTNKKAILRAKIQKLLIEQYVANGLMVNGKQIPIDQYASFLDMNTTELMRAMNKAYERIGSLFENDNKNTFTRGVLFGLLKKSLEISESCKSQSLILKANQGDKFVPFLSGELNRSLANEVSSLKPAIDLLKILSDKAQENPFGPNTNVERQQNIYITNTEATKILADSGHQSMLQNATLIADEAEEIGPIPEVGAKYQDLTKIGLKHKGIEAPNNKE